MAENLDVLDTAVSLLIRAVLRAARFSGRVRRRSLKRLATMDADAKAREILFLKDRAYQLEMQVSILQKHLHKKGRKPRYSVRERLLILGHLEAFQIPRRRVFRHFGIARSTLYRWLHTHACPVLPADTVLGYHRADTVQESCSRGQMINSTAIAPCEVISVALFLGVVLTVYGLELVWFAKYILNLARRKPGRRVPLTRRVVVLHILAGAGVVCLLYGYLIEPNWVDVHAVTLRTPKLKNTGFRLVQISDLHCGRAVRNEEKAIRLINDLKPDVIVATGDYLNDARALALAKETLRRLDAPLGKFAIECKVDLPRDVHLGLFDGTGFRLLYESGVTLTKGEDAINIWGLSHEGPGVCRRLLDTIPARAFNVFLFHTPDLVEEVSGPTIDLYLCGHTHGGQVRLPLYGALLTHSKFGKKYESGLYRVGKTTLYVNRGLGMGPHPWLQVRFLARPEITVFDVLPEPQGGSPRE